MFLLCATTEVGGWGIHVSDHPVLLPHCQVQSSSVKARLLQIKENTEVTGSSII